MPARNRLQIREPDSLKLLQAARLRCGKGGRWMGGFGRVWEMSWRNTFWEVPVVLLARGVIFVLRFDRMVRRTVEM